MLHILDGISWPKFGFYFILGPDVKETGAVPNDCTVLLSGSCTGITVGDVHKILLV